MTDTHPALEQLADVIDDRLTRGERAAIEAHLSACASCADRAASLRAVVDRAAALPASIEPPEGLWNDIRATVEARKVVPLPVHAPRAARRVPWAAVAAAVALIATSSATTAWLLRGDAVPEVELVSVVPAAWTIAERGYLANAEELFGQLAARREELDPATVAAVERSLATIDAAIREAREALARDPANAALTDLLASNYRQKVDLLRRATQLAPST